MNNRETTVKLIGPAKINGEWRGVGDTVTVTAKQLQHLVQAKSVNPSALNHLDDDDGDFGDVAFDLAVLRQTEKRVLEGLKPLEAERNDLQTKLETETANVAALTLRAEAAEKALSETMLTEEQIAEIREEARRASVENIGSIVEWLKVEENAKAVAKLNSTKAAKVVSDALGRDITEPEYQTAATVIVLSK